MTIAEMLEQSGVLTLLGMSIVFGFLAIMILCVALTGKFIHAIGADKDVLQSPAPVSAQGAGTANAGAVTAAIMAAVTEYQINNT
jgi:oxaloacetate decarboxylase gamma subunit